MRCLRISALAILALCGCAARRTPIVVPTGTNSVEILPMCALADANHDCLDEKGNRLGPEGWNCPTENTADCYRARNYETADGRPILTPVGCALKKIGILWLFGDRQSVCEKKKK